MTPGPRRVLRVFLARLRGLGRSRAFEQDLRAEMDAHLAEAAEEYVRQGLSPADARRAARLDFGSAVQTEEACRDVRGRWFQDVSKDVGYAVRVLTRDPAFAAVAVLSLALGIGANSAVFTVVDSVLLRPRAVADPEALVVLYAGPRERPFETTSHPSYVDLRDRNGVLSGLAAYGLRQFRVGDAGHVEQVWGEAVSGDYFGVLGVQPHAGRTFAADEDRPPGRHPVAVIGHALWARHFQASPDALGSTIDVNGEALTVIGIAPPAFTGMTGGLASEIWVPAAMLPTLDPVRGETLLRSRGSRWLTLVGRLQPAVTLERARTRFELLSREMQDAHPREWRAPTEAGGVRELFVTVLPERDTRIHPALHAPVYAAVGLVLVIVNLVLLIACLNLAGMLLARAIQRRREIAVRLALGAGRLRIVRQLTVESLLLSLVAGALGLALAFWALDLLVAFMPAFPEGIRVAIDLRPGWRVVAYTVAVSTATGLLFGLAPALQSAGIGVSAVLKDEAGAAAGGRRTSRARATLIVAQVALSLLLLIGAGLVLRSLDKVRPTRLGFASSRVVAAFLTLDAARYDRAKSQGFYRELSERVSSLPGVRTVSLVEGMPGGFMSRMRRSTEIEGYQPAPGESLEIDTGFVGPGYFTTMQIPVVEGRDFEERDRHGAPCVAVVNEAFRERYFRGRGSPVGKHLVKFEEAETPARQPCAIVGVVRDDRWQSLEPDVRPFYWLAVLQSHRQRMTLLAGTADDPAHHVAAIRRTIRDIDPALPLADVHTLDAHFSASAYPFRLLALALAVSGAAALLLASLGVYGLVAHAVARRTREVGIRVALGAVPTDILRLVVGQSMALVCRGLALGLLLSFALTRVLTSALFETGLLFGVGATDAITFAGVTALLGGVALAACVVPARRAANVDPLAALRHD